MINVEGSLLTDLGNSAVLAAIASAVSDPAVQGSRYMTRTCRHGSVLDGLHPRCTEPEKGQGLRQVNQSLGFQPVLATVVVRRRMLEEIDEDKTLSS